MIVNAFTVSYIVLAALTVIFSLPAIFIAHNIYRNWNASVSSESQYALEKKAYLILTIISLILFAKLFLVPFWFLTLKSLMPSIPGAMCLTGIHAQRMPYSFISSGAKLFIPFLYIFWLIVNSVDRKIETMPFMKKKMFLFIPLSLVVIIESISDIALLASFEPRKASCCSSLFDMPSETIPKIFTETTLFWLFAFWGIVGLCVILIVLAKRRSGQVKGLYLALLGGGFSGIITLLLALHTKVSAFFLHAPFHHCVFCLWQRRPVSIVSTALFVIGFWYVIASSAMQQLSFNDQSAQMQNIQSNIRHYLNMALIFIGLAAFVFVSQYIYYLAKG